MNSNNDAQEILNKIKILISKQENSPKVEKVASFQNSPNFPNLLRKYMEDCNYYKQERDYYREKYESIIIKVFNKQIDETDFMNYYKHMMDDRDYFKREFNIMKSERDNWLEAARSHAKNEEYYTGLLDEIAKNFGVDAYLSDDGSIQDTPLRAKMPELVKKLRKKCELVEKLRKKYELRLHYIKNCGVV